MKSLGLSAPHVVAMVGTPGSGKSFFADHFASTFGAPIISWHAIRSELFNTPSFSADEDEIVERMALLQLDQLLRSGVTVVVDAATYTHASRQDIRQRAHRAGYNTLFVWVQTEPETTKKRAAKQKLPRVAYDRYVQQFIYLKDDEPYVVISGKHTYTTQLKTVLKRLSGGIPATSQPTTASPGGQIAVRHRSQASRRVGQ